MLCDRIIGRGSRGPKRPSCTGDQRYTDRGTRALGDWVGPCGTVSQQPKAGTKLDRGRRHDFVPVLKGLCLKRKVSHVTMRAGVFLSIIAGIGCRRAAWLLEVLCHVGVSKSAIDRWIDEVAEELPSADAIVEELNRRQLITEGHFDGFFPRGANGKCVLVLWDEHGRIIATDEVDAAKEEQVKPFLMRLKRLGTPAPDLLYRSPPGPAKCHPSGLPAGPHPVRLLPHHPKHLEEAVEATSGLTARRSKRAAKRSARHGIETNASGLGQDAVEEALSAVQVRRAHEP